MFNPATVIFKASPNFKPRSGIPIKNIVIHATGGTFQGTCAWFKTPRSQVSAHYLVDRDGQILQFVKDEDAAWHVCSANPFCLGIEHVDMWMENTQRAPQGGCTNRHQWWTAIQLQKSAELCAYLMRKYNLPIEAVIGHNDPLLRKYGNNHVDPGPQWPWELYRRLVREALAALLAAAPSMPPADLPASTEPKKRPGRK